MERSIRVRGEEHIGGVMIKLVDVLDIAMDWSDHALWWPAKNTWLHNTRYRYHLTTLYHLRLSKQYEYRYCSFFLC